MVSSGFAQWGNMEPLLPPSCFDPAVWGKPTGFLRGNHMSEVARCCSWGCCTLDSLGCCMEGCSGRDGCFHSLDHKAVLLAQAAKETVQNAPGCPPALPHQQHPQEHVGLTLHWTGQSTGQPATADTSFKAATSWCLDQRLCQQTLPSLLVGSSRVSQPFAASYPCSLKHNCTLPSSDLGQKRLLLAAAATEGRESRLCSRIGAFPWFRSLLVQQGWCLLTRRGPYLPGLPAEGKHHPSVFSGSMAWSGLDLQAANEHWVQSHWEQAGPSISAGRQGLPQASKAVAALSAGGAEVSNIQSQDWDKPGQWIQHNQGLRRNFP